MTAHTNTAKRTGARLARSKTLAAAGAIACLSFASSLARAETPEQTQVPEQSQPPEHTQVQFMRPFGLVAQLGGYSGAVAGIQGGWKVLGGRLTGGWNPILIVLDDKNTDETKVNFYGSGHLNLDLLVMPLTFAGRSRVGGSVGYKFDTALGHGVGVAFEAQVEMDPKWALLFTGGMSFYPEGENKLREDRNIEDRYEFGFPGPTAQIGVAIGMAFFP